MSSEFSKFSWHGWFTGFVLSVFYRQDRRFDCGGEMLAASRWQSRRLVPGSRFKKLKVLEKNSMEIPSEVDRIDLKSRILTEDFSSLD